MRIMRNLDVPAAPAPFPKNEAEFGGFELEWGVDALRPLHCVNGIGLLIEDTLAVEDPADDSKPNEPLLLDPNGDEALLGP